MYKMRIFLRNVFTITEILFLNIKNEASKT